MCLLLDQLRCRCQEAEDQLREAAANIEDERLQTLLNDLAQTRAHLNSELQPFLSPRSPRLTSAPSENKPQAPRGDNFTRYDEAHDLVRMISLCRSRDESCLKQYQWILKWDLPASLRQIMSRQHAAVLADYQRLGEILRGAYAERTASSDSHETKPDGTR
jgi:hypothetical protein